MQDSIHKPHNVHYVHYVRKGQLGREVRGLLPGTIGIVIVGVVVGLIYLTVAGIPPTFLSIAMAAIGSLLFLVVVSQLVAELRARHQSPYIYPQPSRPWRRLLLVSLAVSLPVVPAVIQSYLR